MSVRVIAASPSGGRVGRVGSVALLDPDLASLLDDLGDDGEFLRWWASPGPDESRCPGYGWFDDGDVRDGGPREGGPREGGPREGDPRADALVDDRRSRVGRLEAFAAATDRARPLLVAARTPGAAARLATTLATGGWFGTGGGSDRSPAAGEAGREDRSGVTAEGRAGRASGAPTGASTRGGVGARGGDDASVAEVEGPAGVVGPEGVAEAFAAAWLDAVRLDAGGPAAGTGIDVRERLFLMGFDDGLRPRARLAAIERAAGGRGRPAASADHERVLHWRRAFADELGVAAVPPGTRLAEVAEGRVDLWEAGDETVAVAMRLRRTVRSETVAMVYVPPERRGRGFAGAVVASTTRRIVEGGRRPLLFVRRDADAARRVYARCGYATIRPWIELAFVPVAEVGAGAVGPSAAR